MHNTHKKHILKTYQPQSGRSMVEMLGTLAIMGVLSVGAIGGYSYAMNKHRTNELVYEATKRAQWVGTQLELNNSAPSLNTFGNDSFGGGSFTGEVKTDLANPNQFGIAVSELKEGVCKNIIKGLETETNGVVRAVKTTDGSADFDQDNCADNAEFLLVFNRDLSANDTPISGSDPEVSGEATGPATGAAPEATTTAQDPDEVHCSGNGSWNGSSCYCDNGWQGDNCSEEEPESSEPATINNEPEETTTAQSGEDCSGNRTWVYYPPQDRYLCDCNPGWTGVSCSEDKRRYCGEHGVWIHATPGNLDSGYCSCSDGWYGLTCSYQNSRTPCSDRGEWIYSAPSYCDCDPGYTGADCSTCTGSNCSEEEQNDSPATETATEYIPEETATAQSGEDHTCGEHQTWNGSTCICESGWGGSDCSEDHRNDCGEHGVWIVSTDNANGGFCSCDSGWGGSDCSKCSGHGFWNQTINNGAGGCDCSIGWGGSDCSIENACSGHGTWYGYLNNGAGGCWCNSGYTGSDCSTPN